MDILQGLLRLMHHAVSRLLPYPTLLEQVTLDVGSSSQPISGGRVHVSSRRVGKTGLCTSQACTWTQLHCSTTCGARGIDHINCTTTHTQVALVVSATLATALRCCAGELIIACSSIYGWALWSYEKVWLEVEFLFVHLPVLEMKAYQWKKWQLVGQIACFQNMTS